MYKYTQFLFFLMKPLFIFTGFCVKMKKKKKGCLCLGSCTYYILYCDDCQYLHESSSDTSEWVIIKHILQYLKRKCLQTVFESVSRIQEVHVFAHIVYDVTTNGCVYTLFSP